MVAVKKWYKIMGLYGVYTFLLDVGLIFLVVWYRCSKIEVPFVQFFRVIKYNVQVFPQSAIIVILINAIALTYFINRNKLNQAKGVFGVTVIVGIFLWLFKLYIVNYS